VRDAYLVDFGKRVFELVFGSQACFLAEAFANIEFAFPNEMLKDNLKKMRDGRRGNLVEYFGIHLLVLGEEFLNFRVAGFFDSFPQF